MRKRWKYELEGQTLLLHSLDQGTDEEIEAAWEAELRQRLGEIRSGKVIGEPADKVLAELREKHA